MHFSSSSHLSKSMGVRKDKACKCRRVHVLANLQVAVVSECLKCMLYISVGTRHGNVLAVCRE